MNWQAGFNKQWTEMRPHPVTMTDAEILDWLDEYIDKLEFKGGVWNLHCFGTQIIKETTVRKVVSMAAAWYEEENQ